MVDLTLDRVTLETTSFLLSHELSIFVHQLGISIVESVKDLMILLHHLSNDDARACEWLQLLDVHLSRAEAGQLGRDPPKDLLEQVLLFEEVDHFAGLAVLFLTTQHVEYRQQLLELVNWILDLILEHLKAIQALLLVPNPLHI